MLSPTILRSALAVVVLSVYLGGCGESEPPAAAKRRAPALDPLVAANALQTSTPRQPSAPSPTPKPAAPKPAPTAEKTPAKPATTSPVTSKSKRYNQMPPKGDRRRAGGYLGALSRSRALGIRTRSAANLKSLFLSLTEYALRKDKAYPSDLGSLVVEQKINYRGLFMNPKAASPPSVQGAKLAEWVNTNSDYMYRGDRVRPGSGAGQIVLYERITPDSVDGINVCFGDGSVRFVVLDEVEPMLRKAGEPFK
ncbi:MAG: hypothetical protein OER86_09075 [Phycisphaerae bacterium]|nr:hypothetical protein [Phycisphaerae bacterium]